MSEQMRKEFESWAKSIPMANLERHLAGYVNSQINSYWAAWQASRQSLVVKLPEVKFWLGDKSLECIDDFKKQLDVAGVKYE